MEVANQAKAMLTADDQIHCLFFLLVNLSSCARYSYKFIVNIIILILILLVNARYSYKVLYFQGSVTQTVRLSFAAQRYQSQFMIIMVSLVWYFLK